MGIFDFLNPAKQAAGSGSKWAIRSFRKTKQINPTLPDREIVNNLFAARYMRVRLEPEQERRLERYDDVEFVSLADLVMATLDIELGIDPQKNPEGFADAAKVVKRELAKAGISG